MNVYQKSPGIDWRVKKWGCALLSLLYHVERLTGQVFTVEKVNELVVELLDIGAIDFEMTVKWNLVLEYFNLPYERSKESASYVLKPGEFEVQEWYNPRTNITHFMAGDGGMNYTWDPYPDSLTAKEGHLVSRRVFRKKGGHK